MRQLLFVLPTIFAVCCVAVVGSTPGTAGEIVTYEIAGDDASAKFEGYQAKAEGQSKGVVLVIHDWDGLTDYERQRAEMIAQLGYDAFAVDLYGQGNRPIEIGAKKAETGKLYADRETMRRRILAGIEAARKSFDGTMVVMGYCFGGAATLELARSGKAPKVAGFASFHGGLKTPEGQTYEGLKAPILIAHGAADTAIPMEDLAALSKELEAASATYTMHVYSGAPHAFTVFGSSRYQERADKQSWDAFVGFLADHLGG